MIKNDSAQEIAITNIETVPMLKFSSLSMQELRSLSELSDVQKESSLAKHTMGSSDFP
jgi:hypothetical protein